jgi:hypothetical protein
MSRLRIGRLAIIAPLSMCWLMGCQVFSPSIASKTVWSIDDPHRSVEVGAYPSPQIARICMDDGFRLAGSVSADRSRTYAIEPGNCVDVEASTFELSVPCFDNCASKPLGSGTFEVVRRIASPGAAWILADVGSREVVHLLQPRFYEFCNVGPHPVRLFSDYRITDRDVRPSACGAVRGRDIGVQSGLIGNGSSGAYRYVE